MKFEDFLPPIEELVDNNNIDLNKYLFLKSMKIDLETAKWRVIYCVVNLINGKKYIGQHSTRKLKDGYLGSGKLIKQAILKEGKDNFEFGILEFLLF